MGKKIKYSYHQTIVEKKYLILNGCNTVDDKITSALLLKAFRKLYKLHLTVTSKSIFMCEFDKWNFIRSLIDRSSNKLSIVYYFFTKFPEVLYMNIDKLQQKMSIKTVTMLKHLLFDNSHSQFTSTWIAIFNLISTVECKSFLYISAGNRKPQFCSLARALN